MIAQMVSECEFMVRGGGWRGGIGLCNFLFVVRDRSIMCVVVIRAVKAISYEIKHSE